MKDEDSIVYRMDRRLVPLTLLVPLTIWSWYTAYVRSIVDLPLVLSFCVGTTLYFCILLTKPTFTDAVYAVARNKNCRVDPASGKTRYDRCMACDVVRMARSRHCSRCDGCVSRFDHHCGVVGACVGERNHLIYLLFMIVAGYGNIHTSMSIYTTMPSLKQSYELGLNEWLWQHGCAAWLLFLLGGFGMFAFGMSAWHMYLACTNITTHEFVKPESTWPALDDEKRSPYAKGWLGNVKEFLSLHPWRKPTPDQWNWVFSHKAL